jgi:ribosomal-protein-alanine N-acetyltransferase
MATIEVRPLLATDVPAAEAIERMVYSQPWTVGIFEDELAQPNRTYVALSDEGGLVGYGGVMLVGDEAHITTVVVRPDHRHGGMGSRIVVALAEAAIGSGARSLTLEVRRSNVAAQALYRRFGMAPVGVRKQYYRDEDALIMWAHDIDGSDFARRLAEIRDSL